MWIWLHSVRCEGNYKRSNTELGSSTLMLMGYTLRCKGRTVFVENMLSVRLATMKKVRQSTNLDCHLPSSMCAIPLANKIPLCASQFCPGSTSEVGMTHCVGAVVGCSFCPCARKRVSTPTLGLLFEYLSKCITIISSTPFHSAY